MTALLVGIVPLAANQNHAEPVKCQTATILSRVSTALLENTVLVFLNRTMLTVRRHAPRVSTQKAQRIPSAHSVPLDITALEDTEPNAHLMVNIALPEDLTQIPVPQVFTVTIQQRETHPKLVVGVNTPLLELAHAQNTLTMLQELPPILYSKTTLLLVQQDFTSTLENTNAICAIKDTDAQVTVTSTFATLMNGQSWDNRPALLWSMANPKPMTEELLKMSRPTVSVTQVITVTLATAMFVQSVNSVINVLE